jgi:His-Xaa-Ser system radical SAM maturase HxsB
VGFDWGKEDLRKFEKFIEGAGGDSIKLEFQGGEPTLRVDLIKSIIEICEKYFQRCEFVICSNLTQITKDIEALYERDDLVVSTSIDGPKAIMTTNRTQDDEMSDTILKNFQYVIEKFGPEKISAMPTITESSIENPEEVIDEYRELGFESIFLRPVNYMGFARKRHEEVSSSFEQWKNFFKRSIEHIIKINESQYFDEFYMGLLVRNIFADIQHGFVNFRSPSRFLHDYGVIDFDGKIYPSDEARMLSRIGHVDLSVGDMGSGIDEAKLSELNSNSLHQVNPDCIHCAYMPYCGVDVIDDISRYNRIDGPKHNTWFCSRQTMLFDLIFSKVIERDRRWLDVFLKWIFRKNSDLRGYEVFGD